MKAGKSTNGPKLHAKGHVDGRPCHPEKIRSLKMQPTGVNTSLSEQIFALFRGYANTFNSMFPQSHRFYVLAYSRRYNGVVQCEDASHLNHYSTTNIAAQKKKLMKRPGSRPYVSKRPASQAISVWYTLKRPSASTPSSSNEHGRARWHEHCGHSESGRQYDKHSTQMPDGIAQRTPPSQVMKHFCGCVAAASMCVVVSNHSHSRQLRSSWDMTQSRTAAEKRTKHKNPQSTGKHTLPKELFTWACRLTSAVNQQASLGLSLKPWLDSRMTGFRTITH